MFYNSYCNIFHDIWGICMCCVLWLQLQPVFLALRLWEEAVIRKLSHWNTLIHLIPHSAQGSFTQVCWRLNSPRCCSDLGEIAGKELLSMDFFYPWQALTLVSGLRTEVNTPEVAWNLQLETNYLGSRRTAPYSWDRRWAGERSWWISLWYLQDKIIKSAITGSRHWNNLTKFINLISED